ncbi:nuclear transport factor 2 family protein [Jiulongibacter sediminis]|jgi:hypothetical protein|uniref:nuclear transport factor 2 family protein n=1 Tax=Jiulongibacter sediminis TaxID=1605367 RepID=UPI0026EF71BA|nr:nuclear transport factor 2 family protein [Jiulongibacter sediminis]
MKKLTFLFLLPIFLHAQKSPIESEILKLDSLFWHGYNTCDETLMQSYLTKEVEFYHDKGGITFGRDALINTTRENLCSNPDSRIFRTPEPSSIKIYLLRDNGISYGVVLEGIHYFSQNGHRVGVARFNHLWLLKDGLWQMQRILSYDHQEVSDLVERKVIKLSADELSVFSGLYQSTAFGEVIIKPSTSGLILSSGGNELELYPMTATEFFVKGRDLRFKFDKEKIVQIIEKGEKVDELLFKSRE